MLLFQNCEETRCQGRTEAVGFLIEPEVKRVKVAGVLQVFLFPEQCGIGFDQAALCFRYSAFEQIRVDRTFIDVEKSDVIESHFMEQDDELDEVRVGLLPEGFLAAAEKVVQQRSDVVGERVGVKVVVKRVVAILGCEADFDVIADTPVPGQDFPDASAEVSLHFENEAADAPVGIIGAIGENLLGERVHCRGGFPRPDRPHDRNAGEEASFWNNQPMGCFRRDRFAGVVDLAQHQRKLRTLSRFCIERQSARANLASRLKGEDVDAGKQDGKEDIRRCVKDEGIGVLEKEKRVVRPQSRDLEKEIGLGKWRPEVERHTRARREQTGKEVPRVENSLNHARAAFAAA